MDAEIERRVIGGWAALEHGDLGEARAALQDIYTADPAHPALPLLAAGIRRARPKQIPWRGIVLLIAVIAVGALASRSWNRSRAVPVPSTVAVAVSNAPPGQADPPVAPSILTHDGNPVGTAGRGGVAPRATTSAPQLARTAPAERSAPSDEVQIRQAISRFAAAYSTKWTPVTFPSCDIARDDDAASVTCQSQAPANSGGAAGTWTFSCRKIGDTWKIVRMQPPADLSHE